MKPLLTALPGLLILFLMSCNPLDYKDTAKKKAVKFQLEAFSAALKKYVADTGEIPDEPCGLTSLVENCDSRQGWRGPYLSRLPQDPWGIQYRYIIVDASNRIVELRSDGADLGPGGTQLRHRNPIVLRESLLPNNGK